MSAPNRRPLPAGVSATVTHVAQVRSSIRGTSRFETDQPTLAHIHRNTWWAIQNNVHGIGNLPLINGAAPFPGFTSGIDPAGVWVSKS